MESSGSPCIGRNECCSSEVVEFQYQSTVSRSGDLDRQNRPVCIEVVLPLSCLGNPIIASSVHRTDRIQNEINETDQVERHLSAWKPVAEGPGYLDQISEIYKNVPLSFVHLFF